MLHQHTHTHTHTRARADINSTQPDTLSHRLDTYTLPKPNQTPITHSNNNLDTVIHISSAGTEGWSSWSCVACLSTAQDQLFGIHWREQMEWDLQLTIDWNRPDLARSEIFDKYNLDSFKVAAQGPERFQCF